MACPSAMSTVWSAVNVLEGFVLSLSRKTSPCGGAWTEAKSEGVRDSQLVSCQNQAASYESLLHTGKRTLVHWPHF